MKTRRSPRNQNILWRELGGKPEPVSYKAPLTEGEIEAMWWISKTSRNALLRDLKLAKLRSAVVAALEHKS